MGLVSELRQQHFSGDRPGITAVYETLHSLFLEAVQQLTRLRQPPRYVEI